MLARLRSIQRHHGALPLALALVACADERAPEPPVPGESAANAAAPAPTSTPPARQGFASGTITLITGDRVTLREVGGRIAPTITRGPGRDGVAFVASGRGNELVIIPSDVAELVARGQLDRRLFAVAQLLRDGYGDAERADLPLLLTGAADPQALRAAGGLSIARALPDLGVTALRQPKAAGGAALAALRASIAANAAPAGKPAASPARLWLDGLRTVSLEHSVPQIGAPAAYARGLGGAGVTVAVLDTGVDATHPDLAGKIAAAESFVDDAAGTTDPFGHGTHVASIIAGSGAASAGLRHGVAPEATLLNGRVCDTLGRCPESAILAGMSWAVAQDARIINLSLGSPDTPGEDPLEAAVNQLSAQHGVLFVVAAGNSGFLPQSIGSPGSADAALTVGAVDVSEARAPFSSRGPRLGDEAIKPDVTAPGVSIAAARATGTTAGLPVDEFYIRLSGTSMATPHVAGVAALLLEQHPSWTGAQLKAALMNSAQPNETLTADEQGAGRVDADRATAQALFAEPPSLSLGVASFPHDDDPQLVRTVRYRNEGAAPITLTLTAALTGPDGAPAPAAMITVAPASLTVPAGGAAEAIVTVDTSVLAAEGRLTGALVASGDGARTVTPIAVTRELESYDLTVRVLDAEGQPGSAAVAIVGTGAASDTSLEAFISGEQTFRVRSAEYVISSTDFDADDLAPSDASLGHWLLAPRFPVTAPTTAVMDSRIARPVALTLPERDLAFRDGTWELIDEENGLVFFIGSPRPIATGEIGPSAAPGEVRSLFAVFLTDAETRARSVYHLARAIPDHFGTGWKQTFHRKELAIVEAAHAAPEDRLMVKTATPFPLAGGFLLPSFATPPYESAFRRTEHYYGEQFLWHVEVRESVENPGDPELPIAMAVNNWLREYPAGARARESWNQAPFGPAFPERMLFSLLPDFSGAPTRVGDQLLLAPSLFAAQSRPARDTFPARETNTLKLYRNGTLLVEHVGRGLPRIITNIPAEPATYRLAAEATRPAADFELSTRVTAAWTFHSAAGSDVAVLPLPTLRFEPALDAHNRSAAARLLVPVRVEYPAGVTAPALAELHVEVSHDDGESWSPVPLVRLAGLAFALVPHPHGATHVSLRGRVRDVAGNGGEVSIVRAYALAPH
jgi:subtilisin family serine protease